MRGNHVNHFGATVAATVLMIAAMALSPFNLFSETHPFAPLPFSAAESTQPDTVAAALPEATLLPDSIPVGVDPVGADAEVVGERFSIFDDRVAFQPTDTVSIVEAPELSDDWQPRAVAFNPDPTRAVWLAALFPGAGQLYNRRYWKLPLVVGGYLGLGYATNWNNGMLSDYTKAYADIMDDDPTTKSYMDFFPPTVREEDLDKTWLTNVLQSRKNYFRRNRDLCIIGMVGVYLLAIVDAYVDASLAHFDISPDLSMEVYPSLMQDGRNRLPSVGLQWALVF